MTALRTSSALPGTLRIMEEILAAGLEAIRQTEQDIAELEHDLSAASNDWAAQTATLKLTAARECQAKQIAQAAKNLRSVESLRRWAGMEPSVLARIFIEYNRGK